MFRSHNHGSCVHYYSPARSDLFYWWSHAIIVTPGIDHQTVNWNLFTRLSITIHQHPSIYNVRMFWYKCIWCPRPFLSILEEWRGYRGVTFARGSHCRLWRKCSGSHSRRGVTHDGKSFTWATRPIVTRWGKPTWPKVNPSTTIGQICSHNHKIDFQQIYKSRSDWFM